MTGASASLVLFCGTAKTAGTGTTKGTVAGGATAGARPEAGKAGAIASAGASPVLRVMRSATPAKNAGMGIRGAAMVAAAATLGCPLSRALFRCLSALAPCALLPCVLGSLSLLQMLSALGAVARSGSSGRPLPGAYPGTHTPPGITTPFSYNGAPNPADLQA